MRTRAASEVAERMMRQRQQPPRPQHTSTESLASVFSQAISILSRTSSNLGEERLVCSLSPYVIR